MPILLGFLDYTLKNTLKVKTRPLRAGQIYSMEGQYQSRYDAMLTGYLALIASNAFTVTLYRFQPIL